MLKLPPPPCAVLAGNMYILFLWACMVKHVGSSHCLVVGPAFSGSIFLSRLILFYGPTLDWWITCSYVLLHWDEHSVLSYCIWGKNRGRTGCFMSMYGVITMFQYINSKTLLEIFLSKTETLFFWGQGGFTSCPQPIALAYSLGVGDASRRAQIQDGQGESLPIWAMCWVKFRFVPYNILGTALYMANYLGIFVLLNICICIFRTCILCTDFLLLCVL